MLTYILSSRKIYRHAFRGKLHGNLFIYMQSLSWSFLLQCFEISWMLQMTNMQIFLQEIGKILKSSAADVLVDGRSSGETGATDRRWLRIKAVWKRKVSIR